MSVTEFPVPSANEEDLTVLERLKRSVRQIEVDGCLGFVLVSVKPVRGDDGDEADFPLPATIGYATESPSASLLLLGELENVKHTLLARMEGMEEYQ